MSDKLKRRMISVGLGVVGLIAVFFIGKGLSKTMYTGAESPEENSSYVEEIPINEEELPPPKAAMTEDEIQDLFVSMKEEPKDTDLETEEETLTEESQEANAAEIINGIDFEALIKMNSHVYAWISIPGTNIEYPILQHPTDNGYYLNHNIDGSYGYPACIYTENFNSMDFQDPNTVIYGHNMRKKETMFNQLHKFASKDFFEKNSTIQIVLPDKVLNYKVFAAYTYDDRHLMLSFDFNNPDIYETYLKGVYDIRDMGANIDRTMEVTGEDKIITLVTCMMDANDETHRYLVQAVLD